MANPLVVINFSVTADAEAEFNRFYNRTFIPQLLKASPEILNARRYEEFGVGGSLRWYNKQFLTIYQLDETASPSKPDAIFERTAVAELVEQFREWKDKSLHNFSRINFEPTWQHARMPGNGSLAGRPFFLWQLELKPELDAEFQRWYQDEYLPFQIAEIPTWIGAHRYVSVAREPKRHLTFFEADDEATLARCLTDLRAPHRIADNYEWLRRVQPAVTWHDATSFRPIFLWPD